MKGIKLVLSFQQTSFKNWISSPKLYCDDLFLLSEKGLKFSSFLHSMCFKHNHPHFNSSSSMYPLLSWSRTVNTFCLSSSDEPVSPTCAKNSLKSNSPGATATERERQRVSRSEHQKTDTCGSERSITE